MDDRFQSLGFTANYSSNAFKFLGNSMLGGGPGVEYCTDTILRLNSPGSSSPLMSSSKGTKRKWSLINSSMGQQVASPLSLGLGRSSSSSDSKGSSATACTTMSSAKEIEEESSMDLELDFTLHLGNEKLPSPKKPGSSNLKALELQPRVGLELSLSTGPSESEITSIHPSSASHQSGMEMPQSVGGGQSADEGSSSCRWKPGIVLQPSQMSPCPGNRFLSNHVPKHIDIAPIFPDLSSSVLNTPKSSVTCTFGVTRQHHTQHRSSTSKTCQVEGCGKGARGASGRCISHGGGRRCKKPGCHKGAEGRTVYCKAHGGGRRCEYLGCTKSAEGRTDYCIAHGGGRRCSHEGCTRAARGKSGLCIRHGGGKRCQRENCTKSAEGLSGLCISHGGGRRCQATGCTKGAQGSTMFCKAHGGGKRCTAPGCTKGAEGSTPFCKGHGGGKRCAFQGGGVCTKSVHGGTNFCVAHGGGKRCAMPECSKSARGRTDYCVRHGGGKRCKSEGCGKSAQGSTDFCKAHGGGKRCSWGHPGSEFGSQPAGPCNSFARGKTGLCALHSSILQDKRVHGGITLGPLVQGKPEEMKEVVVGEAMNVEVTKWGSTIEASAGGTCFDMKQFGPFTGNFSVGEGRVHGGSNFIKAGSVLGISSGSSSQSAIAEMSEPMKSYVMPQNWM